MNALSDAGVLRGHPAGVPDDLVGCGRIHALAFHVARSGHTATLLPDGKILVVGGASYASGSFGSSDSAELYDPATEAWRTTSSLNVARYSHTATLLPDGRVLVVGGINCEGRSGCLPSHLASAELYDAAKETWTLAGKLKVAQGNHTATLLPDGRVRVAGGGVTCESGLCSPSSLAAAAGELYDAATETWTATGNLNQPRGSHTATLLSNGQVLIAGGNDSVYNADFFVSAEFYNPPTGRWSRTGDLNTARGNHTATLLPNGQVLHLRENAAYFVHRLSLLRLNWFLIRTQSSVSGAQPLTRSRTLRLVQQLAR